MELIDYISKDKIGVNSNETVQHIIALTNKTPYSHVPVVNNGVLVGNVAKEDLLSVDDTSQKLSELEYLYEFFFAKEDDILLEVISNFALNNTSVLPIVDEKKQYLGYLDLNDTLDCFADTTFLSSEGSILLLEKSNKDYTMSQVCQIVESNNNAVLGCFVYETKEETSLITLKVKSVNVNELIQSFRRYDYLILNNLTEDSYLEGLKKRSEYFIKYLNI
ncbi:CBS domain-containing protein [Wenyingzhuangia sp. IMCC45574]